MRSAASRWTISSRGSASSATRKPCRRTSRHTSRTAPTRSTHEHRGRAAAPTRRAPRAPAHDVRRPAAPDAVGKHLGREALGVLVRYLFDELQLHRIGLSVVGFNDRAIWMYKALGFEVEGIERDGVGTEDGFVDDVKMGLVAGRKRPDFDPRPATLEGAHVRLVPLRMEHAPALFEAGDEDDIWLFVQPRPRGVDGYARYIRWALDQAIVGQQLPFAVIRKRDGVLVGTTRYAHIDPPNRTLELGYTFYGKGARRTPVNTESKLLLLRHAFETLGANRVWLQTDKRNEPSQNAIARLGAQKEAELRNERVLPDGRLRTSVVFGITRDDWPSVQT